MTEHQALVLIADDEPNMVTLLRRLFERDGFLVYDAADGVAALEQAEKLRPDLLLLDVQMPGLNGFEVVTRLRQNAATARIPTIFISAAAREPTDVARGLGLGADDYVLKPFNPHELLARARSKIRARLLEERLERRNKELEALVRIGREFNQRLQLDELLDRILAVCVAEIATDQALLCLFDQRTHIINWRLLHQDSLRKSDIQEYVDDPDSLMGQMLDTGHSIIVSESDSPLLPDCCYSVVGTRIIHHGAVLGIILLGHKNPGTYDDEHLRLLELITEQAASAIRNAELYAELRHYTLNLESMVADRTSELHTAQAQLIRSEKLASLGRLAAGIAHEVNNPLQAIRNCLELAIEDIDDGKAVDKELLTVAEQDVQRIRRIVSRLLDFSRPRSGELQPLDAGKVVESVLRLIDRQLERMNIKLITDINWTSRVQMNEDQFKQVILNMILNAQEAMPDGGSLVVGVQQHNSDIYISFTDTGLGIPEGDMPKIFEPFFSTKADGTGLGLAVSYGIVEGHGGRIEVKSEVRKGSTFTIILPSDQ